jgi:hypothetical protein
LAVGDRRLAIYSYVAELRLLAQVNSPLGRDNFNGTVANLEMAANNPAPFTNAGFYANETRREYELLITEIRKSIHAEFVPRIEALRPRIESL